MLPYLLLGAWNMDVMAGTPATILNTEVILCAVSEDSPAVTQRCL